jgi:hypothetical protein
MMDNVFKFRIWIQSAQLYFVQLTHADHKFHDYSCGYNLFFRPQHYVQYCWPQILQ